MEITPQDILVVLIQKEKTIVALSQQISVLMKENQSLRAQIEQTKTSPTLRKG